MQVRKIAATVIIGGGMSAMAFVGSGVAQASPPSHNTPKPPAPTSQTTVKVKVTTTNTSNVGVKNSVVGNGNVRQTATGAAGAINNPQPVLGIANTGSQTQRGVRLTLGISSDDQSASASNGSSSSNGTKVNSANGNGNHSDTSVGNAG